MTAAYDLGCTVGAFLVFPLQAHAAGTWHWSLNQARGTSARIQRRRAIGAIPRPDDFHSEALPIGSVDEYREYLRRSMEFVNARNARIERWATDPRGDLGVT